MLCIAVAISMFFCGYYLSYYQKSKSLKIECRLEAEKIICLYCEKLRIMCKSIVDDLSSGSVDEEKQAVYGVMMSDFLNIHDDLITLTYEGIEDFGCSLEEKIRDLMVSEDAIGSENDVDQNLALIAKSLSSIDEIKEWLARYTRSLEDSVRTTAVAALEWMESKESYIKMIEDGLKEHRDLFWKKNIPGAREFLEDYSNKAMQCRETLKTMKNRQNGQS